MIFSHKILLDPTKEQIEALEEHCRVSDDVFNVGLSKCQSNGLLTHRALKTHVSSVMREKDKALTHRVHKSLMSVSIYEVRKCLKNKNPCSWPLVKGRQGSNRFKLFFGQFQINEMTLRVHKIGDIQMSQPLRYNGEILNATFSKKRKSWYVSVDVRVRGVHKNNKKCHFMYISSSEGVISPGENLRFGMNVQTPLPALECSPLTTSITKDEKRLERYKRRLRRSKEGSRNQYKKKKQIAKTQNRIIRRKAERLRCIANFITSTYGVVHLSYRVNSDLPLLFKKTLRSKLRSVKGTTEKQTEDQIVKMIELKKKSDRDRKLIKQMEAEEKLEKELKARKEERMSSEEKVKMLISKESSPKKPWDYSIHDNFPTTEFVVEVFEKYDQRVREKERERSKPLVHIDPGAFPTVDQVQEMLFLRDQHDIGTTRTTGSSPGIACGDPINGSFKSLDQQIEEGLLGLKIGSMKQEHLVVKEPDDNELIAKNIRERNLAEFRARERKRILEEEYGPRARNREELY